MWKRRAEIAVLALLVAVAGQGGHRPHVRVSAPELDLATMMPERIDSARDVGMVALAITIRLLD